MRLAGHLAPPLRPPPAQVLECMKKGNDEMAKIYAADAIRAKNEALNFLRLSSRIDAVAGRVRSCCAARGAAVADLRRRRLAITAPRSLPPSAGGHGDPHEHAEQVDRLCHARAFG